MKQNFIETKKKTRPSLMPPAQNNNLFFFQKLITQKNVPIQSQTSFQSSIVNHQNESFSISQLNLAFDYISKGTQKITMKSLEHYLEEQDENPYVGVEMVSLLDQNSKGYVTRDQFIDFFQRNVIAKEPQIPHELSRDKQWINFIEKNSELLNNFTDINFCKYAAKVISQMEKDQDRLSRKNDN